jgi:endonuclease/exonuclease/phosphatase family metal-dependent hydrolase
MRSIAPIHWRRSAAIASRIGLGRVSMSKIGGDMRAFLIIVALMLPALAYGSVPVKERNATPSLFQPPGRHVRVMTWNIGANSIFPDQGPRRPGRSDSDRPLRARRILRAIAPDVICFQEVFPPRDAADIAQLMDETLPLDGNQRWQVHGRPDVVIASRYPLSMRDAQSEDWGGGVPRTHAMALVDLPHRLARTDLYVLCAHAQSRGEPQHIRARQEQADAIVAWLRGLRTSRAVRLRRRTPIVLMGDWNAYPTDAAAHIATLLSGEIANRTRFGVGAPLDWDRSSLRDALPSHNAEGRLTYTFGDGSAVPFPPGALDRILFTDSVLEMRGGFVLNTTTLGQRLLDRFDLRPDDVLLNIRERTFDHLPVVIDLTVR